MSPTAVTIVTRMAKLHIGLRVKQLRERFRWTQGQLADRTGLARSYITRLEMGERNPKRETLERFAEAFRMSVDELLDVSKVREEPASYDVDRDERIEEITANLLTMRELNQDEIDRVAVIVAAMTEDLKRRRKEEDDAERRRRASQQS